MPFPGPWREWSIVRLPALITSPITRLGQNLINKLRGWPRRDRLCPATGAMPHSTRSRQALILENVLLLSEILNTSVRINAAPQSEMVWMDMAAKT